MKTIKKMKTKKMLKWLKGIFLFFYSGIVPYCIIMTINDEFDFRKWESNSLFFLLIGTLIFFEIFERRALWKEIGDKETDLDLSNKGIREMMERMKNNENKNDENKNDGTN